MNIDPVVLLSIPAGGISGILFCTLVSSMKKLSHVGFSFGGLFATVGIIILYIAGIASGAVTNADMKNAVSNIEFCGYTLLGLAILTFIISIYINIFIENKEVKNDSGD